MNDDKRKVLEMLEEGKITKQDAQRLLAALGNDGESTAFPTAPQLSEIDEAFEKAEHVTANIPSVPALTLQYDIPEIPEIPDIPEMREDYETDYYEDDNDESACVAFSEECENVEELNISWVNGTVEVLRGDGDRMSVVETAKRPLTENERLVLKAEDGEVTIQFMKKPSIFGKMNMGKLAKHLVVTLPRGVEKLSDLMVANVSGDVKVDGITAEDMNVSSVSGTVYATDLRGEEINLSAVSGTVKSANVSADTLNVSCVSGKANINGFNAKEAELSTVSGDLEAEGCAENISLSTTSGKQTLCLTGCPEQMSTHSVSGKTVLAIPELPGGFTVSYNSMSGKLNCEYPLNFENTASKKSGRGVYGNGDLEIGMSSTSGDFKIIKA